MSKIKKLNVSEVEGNQNSIFPAGTIWIDLQNRPRISDGVTQGGQALISSSTDLGNFKIQGSTLGTTDNPDTGNWGGYNITLDPGGESASGVYIPGLSEQTTGAQLQIYNTDSSGGIIALNSHGGVNAASARGTLTFGADLGELGSPSHYHIAFEDSNNTVPSNDLFLGDDLNFVRVAGNAQGVSIGTNNRDGGDQYGWQFGTDGSLTLPGLENGTPAVDFFGGAAGNHRVRLSNDWTVNIEARADGENQGHLNLIAGQNTRVNINGNGSNVEIVTSNGESANTWQFGADGNLTLPLGSTLGETETTTVITPPGALAGQSLVIRPTMATQFISDHPGGFTDGDIITITLTPDGFAQNGSVDYEFTGCTQEQLGRSLTGTLTFSGESSQSIIWTIPVSSSIETFTITLSNNVNLSIVGVSPLTLTRTGSNEDHHIHLVAGDPATVDLYLGDDDQYVKIEKNAGNVVIGTNTNTNQWTFATDGNLTFPDTSVQTTAWAGGRVVGVPASSTGAVGDLQGDIAFSNNYLYYCTVNYGQTGHQIVVATLYDGNTSVNTNSIQLTKTEDTLQITAGDIISDSDGGATSIVDSVSSDENYVYVSTGGFAYNCVFPLTFTSTDYVPSGDIWKRVAWSNDTW